MSQNSSIQRFTSIEGVAIELRDQLTGGQQKFVLVFAYNGTGKTRLSLAFKDRSSTRNKQPDTLYFNSFTEDLFTWRQDPDEPDLFSFNFDPSSHFFDVITQNAAFELKVQEHFQRYYPLSFKIDYERKSIRFSREETSIRGKEPRLETIDNIKVSRGEQTIFIWCFFLAIVQLVMDGDPAYEWVKYIFIDDPISSLDDNNVIASASDLVQLLKQRNDRVPTAITTHHGLFFNVLSNELKKEKTDTFFLYRKKEHLEFHLQSTQDTPFFHHVAMISELKRADASGKVYTYHFNMLRQILEKTSTFFGYNDFSDCIHGVDDEVLFSRAVNLLSHGKYSIYEPKEMGDDNKKLFSRILSSFLDRYKFRNPELLKGEVDQQESV